MYNRGVATSFESHYIASQAVESITISANVRRSTCTLEKTRAAVDWLVVGRALNNAGSIRPSPPSPPMPQLPSHSTATLKEQSIRRVPAEAEAGAAARGRSALAAGSTCTLGRVQVELHVYHRS